MRTMPKIPRGCQIYSLDQLWWGVSIGGRHYTGHVSWTDRVGKTDGSDYHRHELERDLSLKEAKELYPDHGDRFYCLPIARKTNRFDTAEQLEVAATKWVTANAAEPNWLLVANDWWNPNRPIAAKGWYEERVPVMTELAAIWDKTTEAVRADTKARDAVYRLWYQMLRPTPKRAVKT